MANIPIWPGSSSFSSGSGQTNFGYFDGDPTFRTDIDNVATWCSRRLGYPIVDIELQDVNFYTAYEEALLEYSNQVNTHTARDTILGLLGANTGSSDTNLSNYFIPPSSDGIFKLAEDYGTEAGSGGNKTYYTGSFSTVADQQIYDLTDPSVTSFEEGNPSSGSFTIRNVFHHAPDALTRYFDPYVGSGLGSQGLLDQFGMGAYSPAVNFMMMPLHYDLIKLQGIEFNDQIRRSGYGFRLINNRIRIFPRPTTAYTIYFEYTLDSSVSTITSNGESNSGKITNISNVPYGIIGYNSINAMGKQWIRNYTLALCKEMLGYIRGKYSSVPIPNAEVTLNADDLISAATSEKEKLIEDLKLILDDFSRKSLLERKQAESQAMEDALMKVPLKIYIG